MKTKSDELEQYLEHLRGLPFAETVEIEELEPEVGDGLHADASISIKTSDGETTFALDVVRTHLSKELVERLANRGRQHSVDRILAAPHVGRPIGALLSERGVNYIDRSGNCHVSIGDQFLAHIEGKAQKQRNPTHRGLRAAGYKVLFALLARRELLGSPVREIASAAGVSRQAAHSIRQRLVAEGIALKGEQKYIWVDHLRAQAIDRWLVGYTDVVRPSLIVGRYRTPDRNPEELESRIEAIPGAGELWWYGGSAAGFRLSGHFRGPETVLHVEERLADFQKQMRAIPDRNGPLLLMEIPGPVAKEGIKPHTVHPLLVYSEMMAEGSQRESEAAAEVLADYLEERP